jgi:CubicO group peptidase (beta-lactamase class C family)
MNRLKFWGASLLITIFTLFLSLAPALKASAANICYTNMHPYSAVVDMKGNVLCQPNHGWRFGTASISKMATALTVLQLSEEINPATGRPYINLDASVVSQLKGNHAPIRYDGRWYSVTPRRLLNHTAGLSNHYNWFFDKNTAHRYFIGSGWVGNAWRNAAWHLPGQTLMYTPGTSYRYSNADYVLLGYLVEQASGMYYRDALNKFVLKPLGLTTQDVRFAAEYGFDGYDYPHPYREQWKYSVLGPAGGITATPVGIAKLSTGYVRLLNSWSTRNLWWGSMKPGGAYGAGIMDFGFATFGHTGTIAGVRGTVSCNAFVRSGRCAAVLYNGGAFSDGSDMKQFAIPLMNGY